MRKYFFSIIALVSGVLLLSGGISVYFSYQENKAALASLQHEKAIAAASRIEQFIKQIEQQLVVSVRTAVRAVETNLIAAEIAAKATQLASRQYDQQKARYDAGLSTSRVLLQFQDDLESARFNQLSAQLALRQAVAELRRLEGTSLQRFRVDLPK